MRVLAKVLVEEGRAALLRDKAEQGQVTGGRRPGLFLIPKYKLRLRARLHLVLYLRLSLTQTTSRCEGP